MTANLLTRGDELNHLLQCPRTMLIEGDSRQMWSGIIDEDGALLIVGILE